jgi:hypothetical protein
MDGKESGSCAHRAALLCCDLFGKEASIRTCGAAIRPAAPRPAAPRSGRRSQAQLGHAGQCSSSIKVSAHQTSGPSTSRTTSMAASATSGCACARPSDPASRPARRSPRGGCDRPRRTPGRPAFRQSRKQIAVSLRLLRFAAVQPRIRCRAFGHPRSSHRLLKAQGALQLGLDCGQSSVKP